MWHDFFSALSVVLSLSSLILSTFAVLRASRVAALPEKRLRSLESAQQSNADQLEQLLEHVTEMTNSLKMQRVRAAAKHSSVTRPEMPDPYKDPNGWRDAMNKRIALGKLNGGA